MEDLSNLVYLSLSRYFNVLEKTGYVKLDDVDKLLLLTFLLEFLECYSEYITEEDYNIIFKIINCLSDSTCIIPYELYKLISHVVTNYVINAPFRITEYLNTKDIANIRNWQYETEGETRLVNY